MKRTFVMAFLMLGCLAISCSQSELGDLEPIPVGDFMVEAELENKTVELVNEFRVSKGYNVLSFDTDAYDIALEHTQKMAQKGEMSHANFVSRAQKLSDLVGAIKVAENLSTNYPTAEETFQKWLASDGHRSNIMGDFTHTAVAVVSTAKGEVYYTQIFYKAGE